MGIWGGKWEFQGKMGILAGKWEFWGGNGNLGRKTGISGGNGNGFPWITPSTSPGISQLCSTLSQSREINPGNGFSRYLGVGNGRSRFPNPKSRGHGFSRSSRLRARPRPRIGWSRSSSSSRVSPERLPDFWDPWEKFSHPDRGFPSIPTWVCVELLQLETENSRNPLESPGSFPSSIPSGQRGMWGHSLGFSHLSLSFSLVFFPSSLVEGLEVDLTPLELGEFPGFHPIFPLSHLGLYGVAPVGDRENSWNPLELSRTPGTSRLHPFRIHP